jgi:hypothetical protein
MKNLFRFISLVLVCSILLPWYSTKAEPKTITVELTQDSPVPVIDGQAQEPLEASIFIVDGRIMSPPRFLNEAFNIKLEGGYPKGITFKSKGIVLEMLYNNKTVKVNGKEAQTDVPVLVRTGRTFLPIRFIMETFGATVTWDPDLHKVTIVYELPEE